MAGKTVKQLYGNGTGQSFMDRVNAAKHSVTGSGLAKVVCKATTEEMAAPKKKHLEYLVQCTFEQNVSIPELANLLIERTQQSNWVIVFKSLITIHHLMNYGNERFFQYLASNNSKLSLSNFSDRTGIQAFDMSKFVRQYSRYVEQKSRSYRDMAFDFCKIKRGKEEGVMRKMSAEKLMKTIPILEIQLDSMLDFDANGSEIHHTIVYAAFLLLYKDAIRLFATYNDGIINLIEKYFTMTKKQCKIALDCYKRFTQRMDRLNKFLKLAEDIGFGEQNGLELQPVPPAVYEALENHLNMMEGKRVGENSSSNTTGKSTSGGWDNCDSSTNATIGGLTEAERRKIIEEEKAKLEEYANKKSQNAAKMFSAMPESIPEIKQVPNQSTSSSSSSTSQMRNMKQSATFSPFSTSQSDNKFPTTNGSTINKTNDDLVLLDLDPNPSSMKLQQESNQPTFITPEVANIFGVSTTVIQQQQQQQAPSMFQHSPHQSQFNNTLPMSTSAGFPINNTAQCTEINFERAFGSQNNMKSTRPSNPTQTTSTISSSTIGVTNSSSNQPISLDDKLASLVSSLDMSPASKLPSQPITSVNWGSSANANQNINKSSNTGSNLTANSGQWGNSMPPSNCMMGPNMNYGMNQNMVQAPMMNPMMQQSYQQYPPNMMIMGQHHQQVGQMMNPASYHNSQIVQQPFYPFQGQQQQQQFPYNGGAPF